MRSDWFPLLHMAVGATPCRDSPAAEWGAVTEDASPSYVESPPTDAVPAPAAAGSLSTDDRSACSRCRASQYSSPSFMTPSPRTAFRSASASARTRAMLNPHQEYVRSCRTGNRERALQPVHLSGLA